VTAQPRVPTLLIERLARGDLPPDRAGDVRARLGADIDAALSDLAESDRLILEQIPPERVVTEVRRRLGARTWRLAVPTFAATTLAFAAALLTVTPPAPDLTGPVPETTRLKGGSGPAVAVWRLRDGAVEAMDPGEPARPGDVLQVSYAAGGHPYGVVFSVDGRGVVTLHHPSRPDEAPSLTADGESVLSQAYELDDAPSHETFVLVAADQPVDVHEIIEVARRTAGTGPFTDTTGAPAVVVRSRIAKVAP